MINLISNAKRMFIAVTAGIGIAGVWTQSVFASSEPPGIIGGVTIDSLTPIAGTNSLVDEIGNIVKWFLWIIGILAVLYLVYGGVLYITAGGDAEKAGKGRTAITNAIIGIIIIVLALAIYSFVKGTLV